MMRTTETSEILADLESRAGASDADYAAWQAERATGITATQIRDLYLGKVRQQDLIDIKLGRKADSFAPTKYTEWGKTRESYLASLVDFAHDIAPESRVFHAADNSRHLASPDGVGVAPDGTLLVGEYKTSKFPIPADSEKFARTGYRVQMVWAMRVTGARRCLYRWEQHNDDWRGGPGEWPVPSGIVDSGEHWIEYDGDLAAELMQMANDFLAELDRQREEGAPEVDPRAIELLDADLEAQETAKTARAALADYCASTGTSSIRSESGSASYSTPAPRQSFDQAAFKAAHPDIYAEFVKTVPASKPTLRVTPKRTKETKA